MSLPARRVGATDVAKLLGLSKYGGPRAVYDRIVGGVDIVSTPLMQRGIREEPRILGLFVAETGASDAGVRHRLPGPLRHVGGLRLDRRAQVGVRVRGPQVRHG